MSSHQSDIMEAFGLIGEHVARHVDGEVIFYKVWGSHSHNTAMPDSDVDYLAVYKATTRQMLSLSPAPDTIDHKDPDYQCHEIGKVAGLIAKGNPGIVEMLFTEKMCASKHGWHLLVERRDRLISHRTIDQYVGYMGGQLRKLLAGQSLHTSTGRYNGKWAYHLVRLGYDALRLAEGKSPVVWKTGPERDLLMQIRRGEMPCDAVIRHAEELMAAIDNKKPWPWPETVDVDVLNEWVWELRGV